MTDIGIQPLAVFCGIALTIALIMAIGAIITETKAYFDENKRCRRRVVELDNDLWEVRREKAKLEDKLAALYRVMEGEDD